MTVIILMMMMMMMMMMKMRPQVNPIPYCSRPSGWSSREQILSCCPACLLLLPSPSGPTAVGI